MQNRKASIAKICGIIGFVAGEVYMVFTVAGPRLQGIEIPLSSLFTRLVAMSLLFGPFGMALGTGIGLLLGALRFKEDTHQHDR
jgi:hypothetical protein